MSDMEEEVTKSLTAEYVEQGELAVVGEWHNVSLDDLIRAGWDSIAFYYAEGEETPGAISLYGEARS